MKKALRRFVALMTAATMLVAPCLASARTLTADGVLELDYSDEPQVGGVILPTVSDDTFDFKIDPNGEMHEYFPDEFPDGTKGIYFASIATNGAIAPKTNTSAAVSVYVKTTAAISELQSATTVTFSAVSALNTSSAIYSVWVPDGDDGDGKYVQLTKNNIETYFKLGEDRIVGFKTRVKEAASDQKLYKDVKETLSSNYDPTDYVKLDTNGAIVGILPGVSIKSGAAAVVTDAGLAYGDLTLLDNEMVWSNESSKLRIINRSSKDYTISAQVTVTTSTGLVYRDSASDFGTRSDAAIHFDIYDVTNSVTVPITDTTGGITATREFDLQAASGSAVHYIYGDVDANTGGHEYKQFVAANPETKDFVFQIKGSVVRTDDSMDAWRAYAKSLTATTRPTLSVVYTFTEKGGAETVTDYTGAVTWNKTVKAYAFQAPAGMTTLTYAGGASSKEGPYVDLPSTQVKLDEWGWFQVSTDSYQYIKVSDGTNAYIAKMW